MFIRLENGAGEPKRGSSGYDLSFDHAGITENIDQKREKNEEPKNAAKEKVDARYTRGT